MDNTKNQSNNQTRFEKNKKGYFRNPYGVIKKLIDEISLKETKNQRKE